MSIGFHMPRYMRERPDEKSPPPTFIEREREREREVNSPPRHRTNSQRALCHPVIQNPTAAEGTNASGCAADDAGSNEEPAEARHSRAGDSARYEMVRTPQARLQLQGPGRPRRPGQMLPAPRPLSQGHRTVLREIRPLQLHALHAEPLRMRREVSLPFLSFLFFWGTLSLSLTGAGEKWE